MAKKAVASFGVKCPFCGDPDAALKINLNDLNVITCNSCDEEFSAFDAINKVTEELARWEAVAQWAAMGGMR